MNNIDNNDVNIDIYRKRANEIKTKEPVSKRRKISSEVDEIGKLLLTSNESSDGDYSVEEQWKNALKELSVEENSSIQEDDKIMAKKWQKALDDLFEGAPLKHLVGLLETKSLCDLQNEDLQDEIFNNTLELGDDELIQKLMGNRLSKRQRERVIISAIGKEDVKLLKSAMRGAPGQEKIDVNQFYENQMDIMINSLKGCSASKSVIPYLVQTTKISKDELNALANIWKLTGRASSSSSCIMDRILSALGKFTKEFPGILSDEIINLLYTIVEKSKISFSSPEVYNRYFDEQIAIQKEDSSIEESWQSSFDELSTEEDSSMEESSRSNSDELSIEEDSSMKESLQSNSDELSIEEDFSMEESLQSISDELSTEVISIEEEISVAEQWQDALDKLKDDLIRAGVIKADFVRDDSSEDDSIRDDFLKDAKDMPQMLETYSLRALDKESRYDIIDTILASKNGDLIKKLINNRLSKKIRKEIINDAITKRDIDLLKSTMLGAPGQKEIDINRLYKNQTVIMIDTLIDCGASKEMISYLAKKAKISKEGFNVLSWKKALANVWELTDGTFEWDSQKIEYAGTSSHCIIGPSLRGLKKFRNEFQSKLSHEVIDLLYSVVAQSRRSLSSSEMFKRYLDGEIVLIHSGFSGHRIDLIFDPEQKLMLVCNRGAIAKYPVKVYTICPERVTEDLFTELHECSNNLLVEDAVEYFNKTLPNKLNETRFSNHSFLSTEIFSNYWKDNPWQTSENCVVKSMTTALHAVAQIHYRQKDKDEENQIAILKEVSDFESYFKFSILEEYLEYIAKDSSRLDSKLLEKIMINIVNLFLSFGLLTHHCAKLNDE